MKNSRNPRLADLIRQPATARPAVTAPERAPETAAPTPERPAPVELSPEREVSSRSASDATETRDANGRHPIELTPAELEARRDYGLLLQWLEQVFAAAARGRLECEDLFENVQAVLERPRLLEALFAETFRTGRPGNVLPQKSLNVGVYALRLGQALGYQGAGLVEIGAAALLHKIGMVGVPEAIIEKRGALGRQELSILHQHPRHARELIAALGPRFRRVGEIVYQCHERGDGSGYPEGRREADIPTEAQIIGLVDVFEALIQPRPYRQRLIPFAAVKTLLQRERNRFPRPIVREFIASFSVFPPFTYVRLNSRAIARVEETEPGFPLRPKVTIVLDPAGLRPLTTQTVRLRESPLLYITGAVNEEELPA